jgi:hypothetical protein
MDHRIMRVLVALVMVSGGELSRAQGAAITRFEERQNVRQHVFDCLG